MKGYKILSATAILLVAAYGQSPSEDLSLGIKPFEENPSYWQYRGEPVLLVGGSEDDSLFQIPNLEEHLNLLASVGGNYIRNTMSSRRDRGFEVYRFAQLPDGRYDLDQWNEEYWKRFDNLLNLTEERDIIVQIEVWDRFDYSREHWLTSPWNPANNISYTMDETGLAKEYPLHPSRDVQPFFHSIPGMEQYRPSFDVFREYQEKFVDKMLSLSLQHGNVLYCMDNETSTPYPWGQYWMQFIRDRAAEVGRKVFVTDMFDDFWKGENSTKVRLVFDNPQIYSFVDISQVNSRNFGQDHWDRMRWLIDQASVNPRPVNHTKIYGSGHTSFGSGSPKDGVERFWRNILGGSASARFHRPTSGNGLNDLAQASLKAVRNMEDRVKMWEVKADNEVVLNREANEAYLALRPGEKYMCYFTDGGEIDLDLIGHPGTYQMDWIDLSKGDWVPEASSTVQGDSTVPIKSPGTGDWLAIITR